MYKTQSVCAVLVAGGSSSRMGFDKLFCRIGGKEVLWMAAEALASHPYVDKVVVVASRRKLPEVQELFAHAVWAAPLCFAVGGDTRTASVKAGLTLCDGDIVAIHDAARPFVSADIIARTIEAAAEMGAAAPAVPVKDTIKIEKDGHIAGTPPRAILMAVQTPQVFGRVAFTEALAALPESEYPALTDDCMVMERAGRPVRLVPGSFANRKITTPEDLDDEKGRREMNLRVGHGYDVHKLAEGRRLLLGGVEIPNGKGLLGHSDADVLLHAVADALLGAAALGDIGAHFPPTDAAYKDADSLQLLKATVQKVAEAGYTPLNVDATVVCQAPRLAPYIQQMRGNIADALQVELNAVSVKATTEEGLGFTGGGEGMAAHCVAMLAARP